jgi:hypothetical protein
VGRPVSIGNARETALGNALGQYEAAPGYAINGESEYSRRAANGANTAAAKPTLRERQSWSHTDLLIRRHMNELGRGLGVYS